MTDAKDDLAWYSEELARLQGAVDLLIEEKRAQAAAHAEEIKRLKKFAERQEYHLDESSKTITLMATERDDQAAAHASQLNTANDWLDESKAEIARMRVTHAEQLKTYQDTLTETAKQCAEAQDARRAQSKDILTLQSRLLAMDRVIAKAKIRLHLHQGATHDYGVPMTGCSLCEALAALDALPKETTG